jgi:hypothetical protein
MEDIKAKKVDSFEKLLDKKIIGTYTLREGKEKRLVIVLPCGDLFIPDGNWEEKNVEDEDKITLSPSIFCGGGTDKPCWHGFLKEGKFITA